VLLSLLLMERLAAADFAAAWTGEAPVPTWSVEMSYFVIAKETTAPENELFMMKNELGTSVRLPVLGSTV